MVESHVLEVFIKPQAKKSSIYWDKDVNRLIIHVKSTPIKGKANKELVELLQSFFKTKDIQLLKGLTSTTKTVEIKEPRENLEFFLIKK